MFLAAGLLFATVVLGLIGALTYALTYDPSPTPKDAYPETRCQDRIRRMNRLNHE